MSEELEVLITVTGRLETADIPDTIDRIDGRQLLRRPAHDAGY